MKRARSPGSLSDPSFGEPPQFAPDLQRHVDPRVAERHPVVEPQEGHGHHAVLSYPQRVRHGQAGQHVQRLDHAQLGIQRQGHQVVDAAERAQVLTLTRDRERAPAADPVDDALRDKLLEGAAHRLAAQPGGGDQLSLGRHPLSRRVAPGRDGLPQIRRELPVRGGLSSAARGAGRCGPGGCPPRRGIVPDGRHDPQRRTGGPGGSGWQRNSCSCAGVLAIRGDGARIATFRRPYCGARGDHVKAQRRPS